MEQVVEIKKLPLIVHDERENGFKNLKVDK